MSMKKLEDIPKRNPFDVPEGYFEKLPTIIQSRVTNPGQRVNPATRFVLQFVVPVVAIIAIAGLFWISRPHTDLNAESMLTSIQTEDLVAYLKDLDFTTEELLNSVELDAEDANQIEEAVYEFQVDDSELEDILNEIEP